MKTSILLSLLLTSVAASLPARERLVTIGGPVTEIVFALGAGAEVVAVDQSSTYPEAVTDLPQVGYVRALGAEGVLDQNPTRIIASSRIGPPAVLAQLQASGIPVNLIENPNTRESLRAAIVEIGAILGREAEASALWARIEEDLSRAEALTRDRRKPQVVFLLGTNGAALAAGHDTQGGGIVELAGGENLFASHRSYKPVSEEALVSARPDIILIATHRPQATDGRESLRNLGLEQLADSTPAQVHLVDMTYYLSFGPRTGEAALNLAKLFASKR